MLNMNDNTPLIQQEVADLLKINKNTVYELIKRGDLQGCHVGKKIKVDLKDVAAYKNREKGIIDKDNVVEAPKAYYNVLDDMDFPETKSTYSIVICGQDIILDMLIRALEQRETGVRILRSYYGSYNGLYAMYKGEVQVATAHIRTAKPTPIIFHLLKPFCLAYRLL
jgi:putative molybdopterin biosynthesis protein